MNTTFRKLGKVCAAVLLALGMVAPAQAAYPEKPITVIIPFGAGTGADNNFRAAQPFYEEALGVKIVTDYKAGAGGVVGANYYMSTRPDGYTLLFYNFPHISLQQVFQKTSYNTDNLVPIVSSVLFDEIITVREDSPFKTLDDLIKYAKENPGKVTVGNTGSYSSNHLTFASFVKETGVDMVRIPFENGTKLNVALLDGQIDAACSNAQWLTTHKGKIRALASASKERIIEGVPTFAEYGINMDGCTMFNCLIGRADMPKEALDYLTSRLATLRDNKDLAASIARIGSTYGFQDSNDLKETIAKMDAKVESLKDTIKATAD